MTIVRLNEGSPLLADLVSAVEHLQAGIRVGVRDRHPHRLKGAPTVKRPKKPKGHKANCSCFMCRRRRKGR